MPSIQQQLNDAETGVKWDKLEEFESTDLVEFEKMQEPNVDFSKIKQYDNIKYVVYKKEIPYFRSGGVVLDHKDNYVIYKGGARNWSLQESNIHTIWFKPSQMKPKEKKTKKS